MLMLKEWSALIYRPCVDQLEFDFASDQRFFTLRLNYSSPLLCIKYFSLSDKWSWFDIWSKRRLSREVFSEVSLCVSSTWSSSVEWILWQKGKDDFWTSFLFHCGESLFSNSSAIDQSQAWRRRFWICFVHNDRFIDVLVQKWSDIHRCSFSSLLSDIFHRTTNWKSSRELFDTVARWRNKWLDCMMSRETIRTARNPRSSMEWNEREMDKRFQWYDKHTEVSKKWWIEGWEWSKDLIPYDAIDSIELDQRHTVDHSYWGMIDKIGSMNRSGVALRRENVLIGFRNMVRRSISDKNEGWSVLSLYSLSDLDVSSLFHASKMK